MADEILNDQELERFFDEAIKGENPDVSTELITRVLADAAEISALRIAQKPGPKLETRRWWQALFAPVGGLGGAFALGAFAGVGLFVGLGDTDKLYSLPVMGEILAVFSNEIDSLTPFETLDFLMEEG